VGGRLRALGAGSATVTISVMVEGRLRAPGAGSLFFLPQLIELIGFLSLA